MQSQSNSPLGKYLRQPKLYINLPSKGQWYAKNNLDSAEELEVYSMTAADEINLKTPDGLYSGKVVTKVIQNCIPGIKDAWMIPTRDFDYIMAAIRLASYGEFIQMGASCPKCQTEDQYQTEIQSILTHLENVEFNTEIRVDDFIIRIRPLYYKETSEVQKINTFVQRALYVTIPKITDEKEKDATIEQLYEQINNATVDAVTSCVTEILTPEGESETNPVFIKEFLLNNDPKFFNAVEETYKKNNQALALPKSEVECSECKELYTISTNLDYASFFGKG